MVHVMSSGSIATVFDSSFSNNNGTALYLDVSFSINGAALYRYIMKAHSVSPELGMMQFINNFERWNYVCTLKWLLAKYNITKLLCNNPYLASWLFLCELKNAYLHSVTIDDHHEFKVKPTYWMITLTIK